MKELGAFDCDDAGQVGFVEPCDELGCGKSGDNETDAAAEAFGQVFGDIGFVLDQAFANAKCNTGADKEEEQNRDDAVKQRRSRNQGVCFWIAQQTGFRNDKNR